MDDRQSHAGQPERDERHCFVCKRDLGVWFEWRKMITDSGPICYACFNAARSEPEKQESR